MSDDAFRRFLESEAERNPFRIEGYVNEEEVRRDAERLAKSITPEDYKTIRELWQTRSFALITVVLKRYGLGFKGITYVERLIDELSKILEQKNLPGQ